MSPRRRIFATLVVSVLVLAGCSSAPVRFYTLSPATSAQVEAVVTAPYRIDVLPVSLPARVDRPQLVVRQGDGRMALLEGDQWIAPLADEVRGALSSQLARQLHSADVHGLQAASGMPVYRVRVEVRRFDSVPSGHVSLEADWSVHEIGGKGGMLQCTTRVGESVKPGLSALVLGHQHDLQRLADDLAGAIRSLADGRTTHCPR